MMNDQKTIVHLRDAAARRTLKLWRIVYMAPTKWLTISELAVERFRLSRDGYREGDHYHVERRDPPGQRQVHRLITGAV